VICQEVVVPGIIPANFRDFTQQMLSIPTGILLASTQLDCHTDAGFSRVR